VSVASCHFFHSADVTIAIQTLTLQGVILYLQAK